eukprot:961116-Amphidinium_carterae.1
MKLLVEVLASWSPKYIEMGDKLLALGNSLLDFPSTSSRHVSTTSARCTSKDSSCMIFCACVTVVLCAHVRLLHAGMKAPLRFVNVLLVLAFSSVLSDISAEATNHVNYSYCWTLIWANALRLLTISAGMCQGTWVRSFIGRPAGISPPFLSDGVSELTPRARCVACYSTHQDTSRCPQQLLEAISPLSLTALGTQVRLAGARLFGLDFG